MRTTLFISALAGLAAAVPRPQEMDLDAVLSEPKPTQTGPQVNEVNDPIDYSASAAAASASAAVIADLSSGGSKRDVIELQSLHKRGVNDPCAPQPDGYGPKATPDTVDAFLALQIFHDTANNAPTPQGYSRNFADLDASVNANSYMGLYTLKTYDTIKCQQLCDAADLCTAINIYYEKDPMMNPADACLNPPSFTNIKCTLWGSGVTKEAAVNKGQYRRDFQVVITGSNGYTKDNPPSPIDGYTGPTRYGGAINAPLNAAGKNTYMGVKYFAGLYNAGLCAAACSANTAYNSRHPRADGTYDKCVFFNAYLLSKNNVADGTYCSLYTQAWGKPYDTNFGQYRGSDYYSVSSSYGFTVKA